MKGLGSLERNSLDIFLIRVNSKLKRSSRLRWGQVSRIRCYCRAAQCRCLGLLQWCYHSTADFHWFSSYKVHTRHASKFSVGRCFLAGDAAHVHTPADGQGMNTGIQDAYNLAWKIAMVLQAYAGDSLLETYNEERLANAKRLLRTTDRAFETMTGEHWYARFFRDRILPGVASFVTRFDAAKEFIFPIVSQIGLNYHESPLSQHQDLEFKVQTGDRMPYFLVDGENVYHRLCAPKFHLIVFSIWKHDYQNLQSEVENKYGDWVDFQTIPLYPQVAEIFGSDRI
ncbi:FAD-dependent monooxygenase [Pleurocapsales cyanobacterium LEGE 10410]|nr:FAD-dependent monooxygenase [Pleurocapsales cyanobacterium LEGE 10410]